MSTKDGHHYTCKITWSKGQTLLIFFIFDGGQQPLFLILRFLTSFFLLSLIFLLDNFILILCSSFDCSFSGSLSNGTSSSSSLSDWGSPPSGISEDTLARIPDLLLVVVGAGMLTLLNNLACRSMGFTRNLETKSQINIQSKYK